jgi:hypothetical protein
MWSLMPDCKKNTKKVDPVVKLAERELRRDRNRHGMASAKGLELNRTRTTWRSCAEALGRTKWIISCPIPCRGSEERKSKNAQNK